MSNADDFQANAQKLEILESVLNQYQEPQFKIMGKILLEIQRCKLYRMRGCQNLREYVTRSHTFEWRSARRYMNAVRVMDYLENNHAVLPTSEKQVRCLAVCSKDEVNRIWAEAVSISERQKVAITAKLVKTIKGEIAHENPQGAGSRRPRPWQDEGSDANLEFNGENGNLNSGNGTCGHDNCLDMTSTEPTIALQTPTATCASVSTSPELKWGRKRSRYHGYEREASVNPSIPELCINPNPNQSTNGPIMDINSSSSPSPTWAPPNLLPAMHPPTDNLNALEIQRKLTDTVVALSLQSYMPVPIIHSLQVPQNPTGFPCVSTQGEVGREVAAMSDMSPFFVYGAQRQGPQG